jgi:hypothetical protein
VTCLLLGVLNLAFRRRGLLVVNLVAVFLAGIYNVVCNFALSDEPGLMLMWGATLVIWGFKEARKYDTGEVQL